MLSSWELGFSYTFWEIYLRHGEAACCGRENKPKPESRPWELRKVHCHCVLRYQEALGLDVVPRPHCHRNDCVFILQDRRALRDLEFHNLTKHTLSKHHTNSKYLEFIWPFITYRTCHKCLVPILSLVFQMRIFTYQDIMCLSKFFLRYYSYSETGPPEQGLGKFLPWIQLTTSGCSSSWRAGHLFRHIYKSWVLFLVISHCSWRMFEYGAALSSQVKI